MYLLDPFILQNFRKILRANPELLGCVIFGPICPEQFFLVQTIIITFISLLALFIVQNFKNILQWIQNYEMSHLWAQNGPLTQMIFFQKTC